MGSRANGTAKDNSDWDLFIFGNERILKSLRENLSLQDDKIDLFIVINGNDFVSPRTDKQGDLTGWRWKELSPSLAHYMESKEPTDGTGWYRSEIKTQEAIKLWSK